MGFGQCPRTVPEKHETEKPKVTSPLRCQLPSYRPLSEVLCLAIRLTLPVLLRLESVLRSVTLWITHPNHLIALRNF
jgi:hypothetical protein